MQLQEPNEKSSKLNAESSSLIPAKEAIGESQMANKVSISPSLSAHSNNCDTFEAQNNDGCNDIEMKETGNRLLPNMPTGNQSHPSSSNEPNSSASCHSNANVIQNNVSINNVNGTLHIGPTFNSTMVYAPAASSSIPNSLDKGSAKRKLLSPEEKEHIRNCWRSKRSIQDDEVLAISKNIGNNWKDVGNALKFNFTRIEKWENEAKLGSEENGCTISDAVYRMLYFWVQWKDEKATVGRLAKALYNSNELDAFECLKP